MGHQHQGREHRTSGEHDEHRHRIDLSAGGTKSVGGQLRYSSNTLYSSQLNGNTTYETNDAVGTHNHPVDFGIYEDTATGIQITVDAKDGKLDSVESWSNVHTNVTTDQDDVDITNKFNGSGWKSLRFKSNKLAKVNGQVLIKIDVDA